MPRFEDMAARGQYSLHTYLQRWGSGFDQKEAAGLDPETGTSRPVSQAELVDTMQELAYELGHPPLQAEMTSQGRYSHRP